MRVASPESLSYQVRWKRLKVADLRKSVDDYIGKLRRDAAKLKVKFQSSVEAVGDSFDYRWSGAGNGRGRIQRFGERAFFIEASSTSNRSSQGAFQELLKSFESPEAERELWAAFGLSVRLRTGLAVDRHMFQSGRTRVEWREQGGRIIAERWGFGKQLLAKHSFEEWARQSMDMLKADVKATDRGLELEQSKLINKSFGLAAYDEELNQLVTLKVVNRSEKRRPVWDWLT